MIKLSKKLFLPFLIFLLVQTRSFANIQMEDVNSPKEMMYRLGTTDKPEIKYDFDIQPVVKPVVQKEITVKDEQSLTYADLSIKKMSTEISK